MTERPDAVTPDDRRALAEVVRAWLGARVGWRVVERLPGLSNRSYRLALDAAPGLDTRDVVVRLPGPRSHVAVDRARELHAARAAAQVGVAPGVCYADPDRGVLVTDWLAGTRHLEAADLDRSDRLNRTVAALARLHAAPVSLGRPLEPGAVLADYRARCRAMGTALEPGAATWISRAEDVAANLPRPARRALCHGDLSAGNVLVTSGGAVWVVDFEYAVDADPSWDLAELASSRGIDVATSAALVQAYRAAASGRWAEVTGDDPLGDHLRWRAVADAIAATWSLLAGERVLAGQRLAGCARMLEALDARGGQR